jgi:hypothetical protein
VIAPLRRRHRRAIAALAVVFPPLFALALLARPEPAALEALPAALLAEPAAAYPLWERSDLWAALAIRTRLLAVQAGGLPAAVELAPERDPMRPDVLVYWAGEEEARAAGERRLPAGAFLLGRLAGARARRFALPTAAATGPGRLYLYSLGHQALLDVAVLAAPR